MQVQTTAPDRRDYGAQVNARVPRTLREELVDFCQVRGLKIYDFVADAIREKLMRERRLL